jgi:mannosyltransferase
MIGRPGLADWRVQTATVICLALLTGALLRFYGLGNRELTIDEIVSWSAASAPSVHDLIRIEQRTDSGKLPVHELALREWMRMFGDREAALRSMSALFGTVSILLVFMLTLEIFSSAAIDKREKYLAAGLAALIFSLALPTVAISRGARMYSMMLTAVLAQVIFVLRARRVGGLANYAATSIFTALAVAINFTALLMIAVEASWLIYLWAQRPAQSDRAKPDEILRLAAAIGCGIALLLPFWSALYNGATGYQRGDFSWIRPPDRWEPISTFEGGIGTLPFPVVALLAIFGAVSFWRRSRADAILALLWMWMPPLALLVGSYLFTPMMVTRYLISSFVPVFIFAAIGIVAIPSGKLRATALIALLTLSLLRVRAELRPGDHQWRDASLVALQSAGGAHVIGSCHDFDLLRYYLPASARDTVKLVRVPCDHPHVAVVQVVVVSPTVTGARLADLKRAYPEVVAKFKGVSVLSRAPIASEGKPVAH